MKFKIKTKVFLGLFTLSSLMTLCVGCILYYYQKSTLEKEFKTKHNSIARIISDNLKQAEGLTDQIMLNTAYALNDKVKGKVVSKDELQKLRDQFKVTDLYLISKKGDYTQSTDDFAEKSDFNFYNFCPDYKGLILKGNSFNQTPILLAYPPNNTKPYKFTQLSTTTKDQIIEVGMHLNFIEEILKVSLSNYSDIMNVSLRTPSGDNLGNIKSSKYDSKEQLVKFKTEVPSNDINCCQCKIKKLTNDKYYYSLELEVSKKEFTSQLKQLFKIIFLIELFLIIGCYILSKKISTSILSRLNNLATTVNHITTTGELAFTSSDFYNDEVDILGNSFNLMIKNLLTKEKTIKENEKLKANYQVASQVAHDIRSPLEALKSAKTDILQLPEGSRRRLQMGINRIEEITYNLLKNYKQQTNSETLLKSEELLSLLLNVVEEKNFEFRANDKIQIEHELSIGSYGHFSNLVRGNFKSLLSNLINNAIESFQNKSGSVKISLSTDINWNIIQIKDNGLGIPDLIKVKLFQKGFTTKDSGTGIGLYSSKEEINSIGGKIEITDNPLGGTIVSIYLPKTKPCETFIKHIETFRYEKVLILDDDLGFHEVWKDKFKNYTGTIEYYHSVDEIIFKYDNIPQNWLLLSDFELMDKSLDGIDVIIKYGHQENSVLVTARSEENEIQKRCQNLKIKLLSKSLISFIDIKTTSPQIVLIDDDKLTHLNWEHYLKLKKYNFRLFYSVNEFLAHSSEIDLNASIYIDSELGDGLKGEVESKKIFELGFNNLFLSTGYTKDSIKVPNWILEVYPKTPSSFL